MEVSIALNDNGTTTDGDGVTGTLSHGQLIVDTEDESVDRLILNGFDISSTTSAAIAVLAAEKTVIVLPENTISHLADGSEYTSAAARQKRSLFRLTLSTPLPPCGSRER